MTKSKIVESAEKFLEVLGRSELFSATQLEAVRKLTKSSSDPLPIARTLVKNSWLTKWQASQLLSGFHNLSLGKYRLADHLGRGELGSVYLAENPKLGRKVALKTLSKKHTEDPQLVKRFLDDASAAAALDHRNIVHVHDVSSEGQRHYVVMEYVTGQDLQSRVDAEGPLGFEEVASVLRQAAEGLQYAHDQGVVHRDIKPSNIMLDDQGVVKILDLGVGHLRQSEVSESANTGELMMSAMAYMAPEHARGQNVDARSDVYSLGGVLYFLLTARAPFSAKTDAERAKIKELKRPIGIADLRVDAPPALVELCDRMMAIHPEDRVASMADVLTALAATGAVTTGAVTSSEDVDLLEPELEVKTSKVVEDAKKLKPESSAALAPETKESSSAIRIDLGDSAKPAVAVAPMDFAINTKKRKKKSDTKSTPAAKAVAEKPAADTKSESAAGAADANDETPEPGNIAPKKRLSKGLLIGGACAAGLLLIAGVGVGAVMLLGGGETQVAQTAPDTTNDAAAATAEDEVVDTSTDASTVENATLDAASTPLLEASTDAAVLSVATASTAESSVDDAMMAPAEATAEAAAATDDVAVVAPAASASEADASPPQIVSDPPKTEPASETPPPKEPTESKPAEKKPEPDAKPAPEQAPPTKPAPAKPKTFVFATAVDLPTPAADAPELTLGQINVRPEDAVFISLDGGDIAAAGRYEFSVQNAQDGVAPRDWEFYLSDGSSDPVVIATMALPEKDLKFKWTPAGIDNPTATNLRNCSLKITAGQDQPQDLALRMPQQVAPVTIDVEKSATAKLPLEGAPDRSSLKMEVTVKGHKSMVEPAQIELAKGGEGIIYFGENQEQAAFVLKLDASLNARGVQIKTEPYFVVPGESSPVRLNKAAIKRYEAAQVQQAGLQNQIFEGQKAVNDNKLSPQAKARGQAMLAGMKQQLDLIDKTVAKMAQLSTDMAAVGSGASLQFRVFSDTFEKQIDLIVTDPNAAPVAP